MSPATALYYALGGGLGAEFLGLDPQYALKYLVLFLIVVAVGGLGRVTGVFYAALIIGVLDFVLKQYVPRGGTCRRWKKKARTAIRNVICLPPHRRNRQRPSPQQSIRCWKNCGRLIRIRCRPAKRWIWCISCANR